MDNDLLEILKSDISVEQIKYLIKSKCLNKKEENVCKDMLKQYAMFGKHNLLNIMKQEKIDCDGYLESQVYQQSELLDKMDGLIQLRRQQENQQIIDSALEETSQSKFKEKTIDLIFKRYSNEIVAKEDYSFRDLENPEDLLTNIELSSSIEYIDNLIGGIEAGLITSIVGTNEEYKTMYALNIAYKAIRDNKNVLFISLGNSTLNLYKRFLCRHSCEQKFDKPISIEELSTKYDRNVYANVYNDFENNLLNNLILYDNKEFEVSSHYNLQRLIVLAQKEFLERSEHGIDLIIIDDFTNMKLDSGCKTITNLTTIVNEYYNYLRSQAKGLLGSEIQVPIIITSCCTENSILLLQNGYDYVLNFVNEEMRKLSDNIISIYGDKYLKKGNKVKIKVLKSMTNTMEESKTINADYNHWHIKYTNSNIDEETSKDEFIAYLEKDNKRLLESNERLNNILMDMGSSKKIDFDESIFNDLPPLELVDNNTSTLGELTPSTDLEL